jgi:DNA processing protein
LITGISDNVAVIEVRNYSGSLASINWALNQGKDIYVVPSPLNEEDTINNQIIKDGAFLLTSGEDLIKKF